MPRTKISEFSATPGNNTDIDGINLAEGCAPSGINDAIRELMAQLKDFQAGTAGDSFNGPVGTTTPAAGAFTNFSASGTFALTGDQVQISEGGTGQTTANAAFNALAPSQSTHAGKYLKTDGTNTSWDALDISTADITGTLPVANGGTGLTALGTGVQTALGQNVTGSGGIVLASSPTLTTPNLGTPSAVTLTNATGLPLSTGVTGTLATTNGGTGLTSFTANGVVYASSTSALTTGSALTFDGTNIDLATVGAKVNFATTGSATRNYVGVSADGYSLEMVMQRGASQPLSYKQNFSVGHEWGIAGSGAMTLTSTGLGIGTSSISEKLEVWATASGYATGFFNANANTGAGIAMSTNNKANTWFVGARKDAFGGAVGTDRFNILYGTSAFATFDTSGNLGIGTVSPGRRLDVAGNGRVTGGNGIFFEWNNGTDATYVSQEASAEFRINQSTASANSKITFLTQGTLRATLDGAGNLGLGVTPSAWSSSAKALEIGIYAGFYRNASGITAMSFNSYQNTSNIDTYRVSANAATKYEMAGGHAWYIAPSGTAGNAISFTQALTLTSDGNLCAGATSSSFRLVANVQSGANRDIFSAQVEGASNGFQIKWNHATSTTRVNIANLPTSSAGLASGDLWNDSGTLKVA